MGAEGDSTGGEQQAKVLEFPERGFRFPGFVPTDCPKMDEALRILERAAPTDVTVLISGETGVGKELAAKAIHENSPRAKGPFVGVNCGAISEHLLESELFGHVKGAFTGAVQNNRGQFVAANEGTLFFDEIAELPLFLQSKLLRVLQERTVKPVGAIKETPVDVRIVAATNKNLQEMVQAGKFREDLFHRLDVIGVTMPPLRDYGDTNILQCALFMMEHICREQKKSLKPLSEEVTTAFMRYAWPGNLRELYHVLTRVIVLSQNDVISIDDIGNIAERSRVDAVRELTRDDVAQVIHSLFLEFGGGRSLTRFFRDAKQGVIKNVYASVGKPGGDESVTSAARRLGTHRQTIHQILRRARRNGGKGPKQTT